MTRFFLMLPFALMLSACGSTPDRQPAEAANSDSEVVSPAQFLAWLDDLQAGLEDGEPRELNAVDLAEVDALASELRSLLAGVDDISTLNPNQKAMIFNTSEALWGVVSGNESDRVVCRKERQAGTHFKRTRCRSVAELRREDRETQMWLRTIRGPGPMPSGG